MVTPTKGHVRICLQHYGYHAEYITGQANVFVQNIEDIPEPLS